MNVTFTKLAGRRYQMTVDRDRGPTLAPRNGPGYHDYLPHDAVHFLVEAEAHLSGGAFGRVAAGRNNIFWPADPTAIRRQARREAHRRPSAAEHADMARSEELASVCQPLWEFRTGRRADLPEWFTLVRTETLESTLVGRIIVRLDDFANRWHSLPIGGSVTLSWPRRSDSRKAPGGVPSPTLSRKPHHSSR